MYYCTLVIYLEIEDLPDTGELVVAGVQLLETRDALHAHEPHNLVVVNGEVRQLVQLVESAAIHRREQVVGEGQVTQLEQLGHTLQTGDAVVVQAQFFQVGTVIQTLDKNIMCKC